MPFGALFLGGVFVSILAPPFYVYAFFMEDRYFVGPCLFVAWLVWLRFGLRLLGWTLRGIEYSSL